VVNGGRYCDICTSNCDISCGCYNLDYELSDDNMCSTKCIAEENHCRADEKCYNLPPNSLCQFEGQTGLCIWNEDAKYMLCDPICITEILIQAEECQFNGFEVSADETYITQRNKTSELVVDVYLSREDYEYITIWYSAVNAHSMDLHCNEEIRRINFGATEENQWEMVTFSAPLVKGSNEIRLRNGTSTEGLQIDRFALVRHCHDDYVVVTEASSCEDAGYATIRDDFICAEAATSLRILDANASNVLTENMPHHKDGCHVQDSRLYLSNGSLIADEAYNYSTTGCICEVLNPDKMFIAIANQGSNVFIVNMHAPLDKWFALGFSSTPVMQEGIAIVFDEQTPEQTVDGRVVFLGGLPPKYDDTLDDLGNRRLFVVKSYEESYGRKTVQILVHVDDWTSINPFIYFQWALGNSTTLSYHGNTRGVYEELFTFLRCNIVDSDECLQSSPGWDSDASCSMFNDSCVSDYLKDVYRCCPVTCNVALGLSATECETIESNGTCIYPNEAWECEYPNNNATTLPLLDDMDQLLIIFIGVSAFLVFCVLVLIYRRFHNEKKLTELKRGMETIEMQTMHESFNLDKYNIDFADLKGDWSRGKEIGVGAYGRVFKAKYGGNTVAVKFVENLGNKEIYDDDEFKVLVTIDHPNLIRCYGRCIELGNECMVFEYIDGDSLYQLIDKIKCGEIEVSMLERIKILHKACMGLRKLHKFQIVHRDLAARNIMVSSDFSVVKIIDFGMSRMCIEEDHGRTKSLDVAVRWCSPELVQKSETIHYSFKSDIWAFGCTMLELLDLTYPFDNMDLFEVVVNLRHKTHAPKINSDWHPEIQSILAQCWDFEPENRPTAKDVYYALQKIVDPNSSITSTPNDTNDAASFNFGNNHRNPTTIRSIGDTTRSVDLSVSRLTPFTGLLLKMR